MIQTRYGVFETNSSSVHSICISKEKTKSAHRMVHLRFGEYGWERDEYSASDYL